MFNFGGETFHMFCNLTPWPITTNSISLPRRPTVKPGSSFSMNSSDISIFVYVIQSPERQDLVQSLQRMLAESKEHAAFLGSIWTNVTHPVLGYPGYVFAQSSQSQSLSHCKVSLFGRFSWLILACIAASLASVANAKRWGRIMHATVRVLTEFLAELGVVFCEFVNPLSLLKIQKHLRPQLRQIRETSSSYEILLWLFWNPRRFLATCKYCDCQGGYEQVTKDQWSPTKWFCFVSQRGLMCLWPSRSMADIGTSVHGLGVSGIVWEAEDIGSVASIRCKQSGHCKLILHMPRWYESVLAPIRCADPFSCKLSPDKTHSSSGAMR